MLDEHDLARDLRGPHTAHLALTEKTTSTDHGYELVIAAGDDTAGVHLTVPLTLLCLTSLRQGLDRMLDAREHLVRVDIARGSVTLTRSQEHVNVAVRTDVLTGMFAVRGVALAILQWEAHEFITARLAEVERVPTVYGWAHADDGSACVEPEWCVRERVRTPTEGAAA